MQNLTDEPFRALSKHIVCRKRLKVTSRVIGGERTEAVETASGLVLPASAMNLQCDGRAHDMEVMASVVPDLPPGTQVLINVSEISAFLSHDVVALPESDVWVVVEGDTLRVRGQHVLVAPDLKTTMRLIGAGNLVAPGSVVEHGVAISGDDNPTDGGDRNADVLTARAGPVVGLGPDVPKRLLGDLELGELVAYSPSYCCTTIAFNGKIYEVIPAEEILLGLTPE